MIIFENRNDFIGSLPQELVICEIGVFRGEFSQVILESISPKELHLIDLFDGMMCSGDKDGNNIIWINLNEEYINLNNKFSPKKNIRLHKGKSVDILQNFHDGYFDMIYVDGDHSYDGVFTDLEIARFKVKKDGLICGHDYTQKKFPEVFNAVNDFCEKYGLNIKYITNDGCPTFGIINKKN